MFELGKGHSDSAQVELLLASGWPITGFGKKEAGRSASLASPEEAQQCPTESKAEGGRVLVREGEY